MQAVKLVNHKPNYKRLYGREKRRLASALEGVGCNFHHVGSTAVRGLGGKGFIDIQVAVKRKGLMGKAKKIIGSMGYEHPDEGGAPGRLFMRKITPKNTYHVHIVAKGSKPQKSHLAFRDYLREHPKEAREYMKLKKQLAKKARTRMEYRDSKDEYIQGIMKKA